MSKLTDLEAALVAKQEADRGTQAWHDARFRLMDMLLNTEDTIAALVAVAEAVERESDCPLCGAETHTAGRRAVPEPHLPDCPLAPLVKEADHE